MPLYTTFFNKFNLFVSFLGIFQNHDFFSLTKSEPAVTKSMIDFFKYARQL